MRAFSIALLALVLVAAVFAQGPAPKPAPGPNPATEPVPQPQPTVAPSSPVQAPTQSTPSSDNATTASSPVPSPNPDLPPNVDAATMNWIQIGILAATILVGLVWGFAGYRLLKPVLFVAGFVLFYFVTYQILKAQTSLADWINMCIGAGAGILGGILMVLVFKIGVFLMGFIFGAVVAVIVVSFTPLNGIITSNIQANLTIWVFVGCVVGLGILVGLLAVFLTRPIFIFVSSCNGAFLVMSSIDKLTSWNMLHILSGIFNRTVAMAELNWTNYQTYVIFGGLLVLSVAGVVVQAKLTAKKEPTNAKPEGEEGYPLLEP